MGYRFTDFPYLAHHHPEELRSTIIRVLRENRGNVTATAEYFGLAKRRFYTYLHRLNLMPEVDGIHDEFGKKRRAARDDRASGTQTAFEVDAESNPVGARQMMLWALQDAKGDVLLAVNQLGLSKSGWYRLARKLEILGEVQSLVQRFRRERLETGRLVFRGKRRDLYSFQTTEASTGPSEEANS